jgi:hypothetical protein
MVRGIEMLQAYYALTDCHFQNDTMEILDEKANGTPMMEVGDIDIVPVTNRAHRLSHVPQGESKRFNSIAFQMRRSRPSTCPT